jgi:UDP-glucose 4-epimerase
VKVLVTGGAGFIGSHLVEHLVAAGDDVTVIDDLRNSSKANLEGVAAQIAIIESDVLGTDIASLVAEAGFDRIFHLAGPAYVPPSVTDPVGDNTATVGTTLRMLEAIRHASPRTQLVYTSSAAIYGDPATQPIHEDLPPAPVSPYGLHKYTAEQEVRLYSMLYGLRTASARLFSVYGPRQHKQVIFDMVRKVVANPERIEAHGDGTQVRDFVFVTDVAHALAHIADNAPSKGEAYNVASGEPVTIADVILMVCEALGADPEIVWSGAVRPGDPEKWIPSIDKLRAIGFEPSIRTAEGIRRTVAWARDVVEVHP